MTQNYTNSNLLLLVKRFPPTVSSFTQSKKQNDCQFLFYKFLLQDFQKLLNNKTFKHSKSISYVLYITISEDYWENRTENTIKFAKPSKNKSNSSLGHHNQWKYVDVCVVFRSDKEKNVRLCISKLEENFINKPIPPLIPGKWHRWNQTYSSRKSCV